MGRAHNEERRRRNREARAQETRRKFKNTAAYLHPGPKDGSRKRGHSSSTYKIAATGTEPKATTPYRTQGPGSDTNSDNYDRRARLRDNNTLATHTLTPPSHPRSSGSLDDRLSGVSTRRTEPAPSAVQPTATVEAVLYDPFCEYALFLGEGDINEAVERNLQYFYGEIIICGRVLQVLGKKATIIRMGKSRVESVGQALGVPADKVYFFGDAGIKIGGYVVRLTDVTLVGEYAERAIKAIREKMEGSPS